MTPLRTVDLLGFPLRIYPSPLAVPDHPWASFDDLATLADMEEVDRDKWLSKMQADIPDMVHRAADGMQLVAEPIVGGLFLAWEIMGAARAQELLDIWTDAWTDVFAMQNAHLPRDEWLRVVQESNLRNTPKVSGMMMQ